MNKLAFFLAVLQFPLCSSCQSCQPFGLSTASLISSFWLFESFTDMISYIYLSCEGPRRISYIISVKILPLANHNLWCYRPFGKADLNTKPIFERLVDSCNQFVLLRRNRLRLGPLRASEILAYDLESEVRRIFSKKDLLPLLLQEIQSGQPFRLVDQTIPTALERQEEHLTQQEYRKRCAFGTSLLAWEQRGKRRSSRIGVI